MVLAPERTINNTVYDALGERWYTANDDPIALLRAQSRLHNPWIAERLRAQSGPEARVLDVGCGAGFLSNHLACHGFSVVGLDASRESLRVARSYDVSGRADYTLGDALALPFPPTCFDAVCAMDFLEHLEEPARAISEAARVLRPGGLFFFHTFNRNLLAWLIVIKGLEWFVANTPADMHVLQLFIKPTELARMCASASLVIDELHGCEPVLSRAFFRLLATGVVPPDFQFQFGRSLRVAYTGCAVKSAETPQR